MRIFYFLFLVSFLFVLNGSFVSGQARLVLKNNPYIVLKEGPAAGDSIFFVLENNDSNAVTVMNASDAVESKYSHGRVIMNDGCNKCRFKWMIGNHAVAGGDYIIPFYNITGTAGMVPVEFKLTNAGVGASGYLSASTWYSSANTASTWPINGGSLTSICGVATEDDVADRFWTLNVLGYTTDPTATVRLYYIDGGGADPNKTIEGEAGYTETDLGVQRWGTGNPCQWESPVGTVDITNNFVSFSASSFSPWAMSKKSTPLPVELVSFFGQCDKENINLYWETASEINSAYFTIERSYDGKTFQEIGLVEASGNSNELKQYFYNVFPLPDVGYGYIFYRIRLTDLDEAYRYSDIIVVKNCGEDLEDNISIFIESNSEMVIFFSSMLEKKYDLFLYDNLGRKIFSGITEVKEGQTKTVVKPGKIATGIYYLTLQNDIEIISKKIFFH